MHPRNLTILNALCVSNEILNNENLPSFLSESRTSKLRKKLKIKRILISQPEPAEGEKSPYAILANKHEIQIDFFKFFRIEGITPQDFRKQKVNILEHTAIVFNSRHAVDHFFQLSKGLRIEIPETMKYFCNSESTALYLQKYIQFRKRKISFGKTSINDLVDVLKKNKNERFLIPGSDLSSSDVPKVIEELGINYSKIMIYSTVNADLQKINILQYDMLVLFSPQGIKSLMQNFPDFQQGEIVIGCFGAATQKAAVEAGLKVDVPAPTATSPSMTGAIDDYLCALNPPTKKKTSGSKKKNSTES